jgi:hypothetical protein
MYLLHTSKLIKHKENFAFFYESSIPSVLRQYVCQFASPSLQYGWCISSVSVYSLSSVCLSVQYIRQLASLSLQHGRCLNSVPRSLLVSPVCLTLQCACNSVVFVSLHDVSYSSLLSVSSSRILQMLSPFFQSPRLSFYLLPFDIYLFLYSSLCTFLYTFRTVSSFLFLAVSHVPGHEPRILIVAYFIPYMPSLHWVGVRKWI